MFWYDPLCMWSNTFNLSIDINQGLTLDHIQQFATLWENKILSPGVQDTIRLQASGWPNFGLCTLASKSWNQQCTSSSSVSVLNAVKLHDLRPYLIENISLLLGAFACDVSM